jgi:hypothetical protein
MPLAMAVFGSSRLESSASRLDETDEPFRNQGHAARRFLRHISASAWLRRGWENFRQDASNRARGQGHAKPGR